MFTAEIICDSIAEYSPRLTTFTLSYPRFIHSEFMTHRMFSRNASSSRAIPVRRTLEEARSAGQRVVPRFTAEQPGMSGGAELSNTKAEGANWSLHECAYMIWANAASDAAYHAERLVNLGVHKSVINRLLEPFLHIRVVCTGVEAAYMNFFGLRLDRAAQPEIRLLAEAMWKAYRASTPARLGAGEWHLPFVNQEDLDNFDAGEDSGLRRISAARCARTSYLSFETGRRSTVEEDLALFTRLAGSSPMHLSPLEHQATPDTYTPNTTLGYAHAHQHGNLSGWVQHRKLIPGEAIAHLPETYRTESH